MAVGTAFSAAVEPVRAALLMAARGEAGQAVAAATEAADRAIADAIATAERLRGDARAEGAADAAATLAQLRSRARREARTGVLAARREEYEALRAAARAAVTALREDPGYPRVRERLTQLVRDRLGPDADVCEAAGGGVIGTAPGRRLDYSFVGFVDRAVDATAAGLDAP